MTMKRSDTVSRSALLAVIAGLLAFAVCVGMNFVSDGYTKPSYGWPWTVYHTQRPTWWFMPDSEHWDYTPIFINALVAIGFGVAVGLVFWFWRRWCARQGRPWFQLHLSTALALVLVAGCLIWVNMQPRKWRNAEETEAKEEGWPCAHHEYWWQMMHSGQCVAVFDRWYPLCLAQNVLVAAGIWVTVAMVSEGAIALRRRNKARRPGPEQTRPP